MTLADAERGLKGCGLKGTNVAMCVSGQLKNKLLIIGKFILHWNFIVERYV